MHKEIKTVVKLLQCADSTCFFVTSETLEHLKNKIELNSFFFFIASHQLTLSVEKTNSITFCKPPRNNLMKNNKLNFNKHLDHQNLCEKSKICLDQNFTKHQEVKNIFGKKGYAFKTFRCIKKGRVKLEVDVTETIRRFIWTTFYNIRVIKTLD